MTDSMAPGIGAKLERASYWTLCAMFFSLSFATSPTVIAGLTTLGLWLLSGAAFRQWRSWLMQEWTIPVLLMAALPWVGLLWSQDPVTGHNLAGKSYYWFYACAAASLALREEEVQRLIVAFIGGVAFNAAVSLFQFAGVVPIFKPHYGFMGYISFSLMLVFAIMLLSFLFSRTTNRRERLVIVLLMLLFLFNLSILKGRAGYLALVVSSPLIFMNLLGRKHLLKILACSALITAALFLSPTVRERVVLISKESQSYAAGKRENTSVGLRLYMWNGALGMLREHPLLGVGAGGYREAIRKYKDHPDLFEPEHPHNSFLHMAVSFGVIGLAVFAWLLAVIVRKGWRERQSIAGFATLAYLIVFIIGSMTDTMLIALSTGNMLAIFTGLTVRGTAARAGTIPAQ